MLERNATNSVMPGEVPGIHEFAADIEDVDGRVKPGHDRNVVPGIRSLQYKLDMRATSRSLA